MEDGKLLRNIPLFKDFQVTELMNVAMVAGKERHGAGELIIKEKSRGDAFYVIKSGRVRVTKRDSFGDEHVLAYLGPGEYFGEMCLVDRDRRSASVFAGTNTEVLKIKHAAFQNLI